MVPVLPDMLERTLVATFTISEFLSAKNGEMSRTASMGWPLTNSLLRFSRYEVSDEL
jgi:hypothetical protein